MKSKEKSPKKTKNENEQIINDNKTVNYYHNVDGLTIRIAVFGESKSGKSSLINCYLDKSFSQIKKDTILDIYAKKIVVNKYIVTIVVSEISLDKKDISLLRQIANESHIIFLCYSLEDKSELITEGELDEILNICKDFDKEIPIFLVGCKLDLLKENQIKKMNLYDQNIELNDNGLKIKEFLSANKNIGHINFYGYYMTSALLNMNIDNLFNDAIKTVCYPYFIKTILLEQEKMEKDKKGKKNKKISGSNSNNPNDLNTVKNIIKSDNDDYFDQILNNANGTNYNNNINDILTGYCIVNNEIVVDENGCFIF